MKWGETKIISNFASQAANNKTFIFRFFFLFFPFPSSNFQYKRFRAPSLHMSWSWFSLTKQRRKNLITIHALKTGEKRNEEILSQLVFVFLVLDVLILGRLLLVKIHNGDETFNFMPLHNHRMLINLEIILFDKVLILIVSVSEVVSHSYFWITSYILAGSCCDHWIA